jgi:hypothetical protein
MNSNERRPGTSVRRWDARGNDGVRLRSPWPWVLAVAISMLIWFVLGTAIWLVGEYDAQWSSPVLGDVYLVITVPLSIGLPLFIAIFTASEEETVRFATKAGSAGVIILFVGLLASYLEPNRFTGALVPVGLALLSIAQLLLRSLPTRDEPPSDAVEGGSHG